MVAFLYLMHILLSITNKISNKSDVNNNEDNNYFYGMTHLTCVKTVTLVLERFSSVNVHAFHLGLILGSDPKSAFCHSHV